MAETSGLLNRRTLKGVPRVRIPPPPPLWNTNANVVRRRLCDLPLCCSEGGFTKTATNFHSFISGSKSAWVTVGVPWSFRSATASAMIGTSSYASGKQSGVPSGSHRTAQCRCAGADNTWLNDLAPSSLASDIAASEWGTLRLGIHTACSPFGGIPERCTATSSPEGPTTALLPGDSD